MFQAKLLKFDQPLAPEDILRVLVGQRGWLSRRQVADALSCSKSPTLVKALATCVEKGWAEFQFHQLPNRVDMYYYTITEMGAMHVSHFDAEQERQWFEKHPF